MPLRHLLAVLLIASPLAFIAIRDGFVYRSSQDVNHELFGSRSKTGGSRVRILPSAPLQARRLVDALREQGFKVKVLEGDKTLLDTLTRFLPPNPRHGTPGGIVFNLSTGVQGEGRFSHVPAMLEMAGIPYTGPDPLAYAHLADRLALMTLLREAAVPVPRNVLVSDPTEGVDVEFPAAARPQFELDVKRTVVRNRRMLRNAVRENRRSYGQSTVVEEIIRGREIDVALLGNDTIECLPLLECSSGNGGKTCPVPLGEAIADRIRSCARAAYRAAGCRDYALIRIRVSHFDDPVVIDVKCVDLFARRGSFVTAADAAGYTFATLLRRIVSEAARRYVGRPKAEPQAPDTDSVMSLVGRPTAAEG